MRVIDWRSGIAGVCVKVGVESLWSADVSLDSLDPETAVLRVHAITLAIGHHVDAPGRPQIGDAGFTDSENSQLTASQEAVLRRMADDRMSAAIHAARSLTKVQNSAGSTSVMLCALRDMMTDDVCAPLAMDYLRAQALALSETRWKSLIRVEGASPDTPRSEPLTIYYWSQYREPALIRIRESPSLAPAAKPDTGAKDEKESSAEHINMDSNLERNSCCVKCTHEPPLPSLVELGGSGGNCHLRMDDLNLEELLLACTRLRGRARLNSVYEAFLRKRKQLRIHSSCIVLSQTKKTLSGGTKRQRKTADDILSIHFSGSKTTGIEIRVSNTNGGIHVRPYGAAALSLPVQRMKKSTLWSGAKHLPSDAEEVSAVIAAFETIRARVKLNAAARSVCGLDIGVSNTLPPGTASVAATASADRAASQLVPPFAPIERRAPRRFLTLSPPPPTKDLLTTLHSGGAIHAHKRARGASSSGSLMDGSGPAKRSRLTYATTSDALVFIQESSFAGEDWKVMPRNHELSGNTGSTKSPHVSETDTIDRYSGTASAAAVWAVTREVVERRLRRDSLLRAFVSTSVASAAQMHHLKTNEDGDLHLESASRILLKLKCEPLPVRRAELLLRGYDAWQVRLSLLPSIFDDTDSISRSSIGLQKSDCREKTRGEGNLWSVGVACSGSQLTFTYLSANSDTVCSFFRDLTRARTAAALARGVPPSRFYRVLRRSPVRIVVGIGPYRLGPNHLSTKEPPPDPLYTATVEYVYSKGNSGGFSLSFSPAKPTMERLAPLIEEALDASGGQVGGILAGLLERACPVAAAAESAVRERGNAKIRFVTALRVRAVFAGVVKPLARGGKQDDGRMLAQGKQTPQQVGQVVHAVDIDARGGSGFVTVIDVGRATAVMIQQGLAQRSGSSGGSSYRRNDFVSLPKWDEIVAGLTRQGYAEAQRAGSTVVLRMELLEQFLSNLVTSAGLPEKK